MFSITRGLLGLVLALHCIPGQATPLLINMSAEGSAEGEESGSLVHTPSPAPTPGLTPGTTTAREVSGGHAPVEHLLLDQVVQFLRDNLLLILVGTSLVAVVVLVGCCASVMSHRRKVSAYYPSSFPEKMYVDQTDKTGGARVFNEVPEKAPDGRQGEPLDSDKQLQEDIKMAARKLRTPSKAPSTEKGGKEPKQGAVDEGMSQGEDPLGEVPLMDPGAPQGNSATVDQEAVWEGNLENSGNSLVACPVEKAETREEDFPQASESSSDPEHHGARQEVRSSSDPEDQGAQQEVKSSHAETQENSTTSVQLISGEITAF